MLPIEFRYREPRGNPTGLVVESPQGDFAFRELVDYPEDVENVLVQHVAVPEVRALVLGGR